MSPDAPASRLPAIGTGLVWLVAAAMALQAVAWSRGFFHDDAYITLRYAQNWLAGNGVGWNPGDRVEGYSNFLQLLLATGLGALGVDLVRATRWIALAAWLGLLAFGVARSDGTVRGRWLASLPLAAVLSAVPLVAWAFGGLEAPLVALFVTVGVVGLRDALEAGVDARRARLAVAGLAFGLACLTRLDTALFAAVGGLFLVLGSRDRPRSLAAFGLPLLLVVAPWLAWKLSYYGSLLPNTWWVKGASPSGWRLADGVDYVRAFVFQPPFPLLWLAAGALRGAFAGRLGRADAFGLAAVAAWLAWIVYVGGDQMPASRLLVPLIPVSAWLALSLWRRDLEAAGGRGILAVSGAIALCIGLQAVWPTTSGPQRNATAFVGAAVGRHLAEHLRPGSLVALNTAGSTPFHAPGLRYLDMLGLNDAHIARRQVTVLRAPGQRMPGHAKGDGDYVLAQQPDVVILGPSQGVTAAEPWFLSDLEIAQNPAFPKRYRLRRALLDVRDQPGFEDFEATRGGAVAFTWYERVQAGLGGRDAALDPGEVPVGYKLGLTSEASRRRFGVERPVVGRLLARMRVPDGGSVASGTFARVFVEGEIAFVLGRAVATPPADVAGLRGAVARVHPAIELANWRFGADARPDAAAIEADAVGAHRFVLGPGVDPGDLPLDRIEARLERDGEPLGRGVGADAMGGPWQALLWLAQRLHERGARLEAGDVVLTGALGAVHAFAPGEAAGVYRLTLDELGSVEVHIR